MLRGTELIFVKRNDLQIWSQISWRGNNALHKFLKAGH